jgi:hypothetical protein
VDFIPRTPGDVEGLVPLILGKSVDGIIRVNTGGEAESEELAVMASRLLSSGFSSRLNLYFNNCYHFTNHAVAVIREQNI